MRLKKLLMLLTVVLTFLFSGCSGEIIPISFEIISPLIDNVFGVPIDGNFVLNINNITVVEVELGDQENNLQKISQDAIEMTTEQATVNLAGLGLENGTKYYYLIRVMDGKGQQKQSTVRSFTTKFLEGEKDDVLQTVFNTFEAEEYIGDTEFSTLTNTGTITITNKEGKTAGDLWGIINTFLDEHEEKAFPVIIENIYDGLDGTYQYANSRLNPDLTYDISISEFDEKLKSGEFVDDPDSLLFRFIDSGARGLKLENASGKVTLPLKLQGTQYDFIFLLND